MQSLSSNRRMNEGDPNSLVGDIRRTRTRARVRGAVLLVVVLVTACDSAQPRPWTLQAAPECTEFGACIEGCLDTKVPDDQVFRVEWCAARCMPAACKDLSMAAYYAPSDFNMTFDASLSQDEQREHCTSLAAAVHYERVNCIDYPVAMCTDGCRVP